MPKINIIPKENGFSMPAEWHHQRAMWLSFPKNVDTWEDRLPRVYPAYFKFIKAVSEGQQVCINVNDAETKRFIEDELYKYDIQESKIEIYLHKTNDAWCRDHGPAVLLNHKTKKRLVVEWGYNAWGGKYPPFDADDEIPIKIANQLGLDFVVPNTIMEGGSVEFNGAGTILTSKSCLLNPNRNPHLNQQQIEEILYNYYGAEQVLWVNEGIKGDDTDGHIDDTIRFVNENTVLACKSNNKLDENYNILRDNIKLLEKMRLPNEQKIDIVQLPMPKPVFDSGERLPATYANFYIANDVVVVPTYRSKNENEALDIIQSCFKTRKVIGIDSSEIIWGLGSFHCLSQQEPDFLV